MNSYHKARPILLVSALMVMFFTPGGASAAAQLVNASVVSMNVYAGSAAPGVIVNISPAVPGLQGCGNAPGNELWIDFSSTTQPDGKALYATVLSAFIAGRTVSFAVNGCGDAGQIPLVYRVDIS